MSRIPCFNRFFRAFSLFLGLSATGSFVLANDEAATAEPEISASEREHWSFQPLIAPAIPESASNATNPIDAFLDARFRADGLTAAQPADRRVLIRRLAFDLTGLPPTPEAIDAFLADDAPDAWERLVDRLLASPAYGERWAQHWLDLARFAETDGFEFDHVRPNAWRYRDWVIDAFNRDLPLAEFVQSQVAGDLLWPDDPQAAIATGFLLCGPDMIDINDQEERRHTVLNELTGTVGSVFLGLSVGCAQCHDHKTDPVSQLDFYRLRAYFTRGDLFKDQPVATPEEFAAYQQARRVIGPIESERKRIDDVARKRLREQNPDLQPTTKDLRTALTEDERHRRDELSTMLAGSPRAPELPQGRVYRDGQPRVSHLAIRGDHRRPGAVVEPAVLRIVATRETSAEVTRADFSQELTRPDHPLLWRVMVNRLWQFHFGEGLVRSASDFGLGGGEPSHPKLLDWLATELSRRDGSLKSLHRLLVTSAAYQRAARPGESAAERMVWHDLAVADPQNRLWGRMTPRRLEGEAIRDAMLAAAGVLSERRGGPGVRPPLPQELIGTLLNNQWVVSPDKDDHLRRSIYLFVRRNLRYPLFEVFDRPDTNATCPRRSRSTVAPQALALLNSELSTSLAAELAQRIEREVSSSDQRVERAFVLTLGRLPTPDEQTETQSLLKQEPDDGLRLLCLALFNANEFLYVD